MNPSYLLAAILVSGLVTFLPRVLPFALLKKVHLPALVLRFLRYLPISIIFALSFSSLFNYESGKFPSLLGLESLASLVVLWVAFRFKNLILTVVVGVILMAVFRLVF